VQALEHAENMAMVLGVDPNAVILQPQPDALTSVLGPDPYLRHGARGHKLHGIAEQIGEDLDQRGPMGQDLRQRLGHR